jgi:hypothetical protein
MRFLTSQFIIWAKSLIFLLFKSFQIFIDPSTGGISKEQILGCSAVLTEMSTTECHRSEHYLLKSCKSDNVDCKYVAQQVSYM